MRNETVGFPWMRVQEWFCICVLLFLSAAPAWGQLLGLKPLAGLQAPPVVGEIYLDHAVLPAGGEGTAVVVMKVAAGFHAQSAKPYEGFIATKVTTGPVEGGGGVMFGVVEYPEHKLIDSPGLLPGGAKLPVYEGTVYILVPVKVGADAAAGERKLGVTLHYQVCDESNCQLPADLKLTVPVTIAAAGTAMGAEEYQEIFAAARAQKFLKMDAVMPATTSAAELPASAADDLAAIRARAYAPAEGSESSANLPLWQLILFALGGGAILNIMPCVLPVIPLKVLTLVQQAHGDRKLAVAHAMVFSAGIVTLFVGLAAVFGALRAAGGQQVVYGQQFSSPVFLICMSFVVLALALSMLNVWTINPPQVVYAADTQHTGYLGSFSMGLLATLLATPCSAPLLGPVLAWALVQRIAVMVVMFAVVGVGMAVPYVVLAAFPAGLDKLPRAGRWTELVKQFLGLVMVGVALYLLLQLPAAIWPWALAGALLLSMVLWGWGQIPVATMERGKIWGIRAAVVVIGVGLGLWLWRWAQRPANENWQTFSVVALDEALAQKRPVVVDFTASWCINCKFVEAQVLESAAAKGAFADSRALLLKADLSGDNPPVKELLAKLDSRSIPVLAIFLPGEPLRPVVLRDVYTRERVMNALKTK